MERPLIKRTSTNEHEHIFLREDRRVIDLVIASLFLPVMSFCALVYLSLGLIGAPLFDAKKARRHGDNWYFSTSVKAFFIFEQS